MKRILFFSLAVIMMACGKLSAPFAGTSKLTEERIMELIHCIPDHCLDTTTREAFDSTYYALLEQAWAKPSDAEDGMIGSEEWLYYFMSGNGEEYNRIEIDSVKTATTTSEVFFSCIWGSQEAPFWKESHALQLVQKDGRWVIQDFDDTKHQLQDYLAY